MTRRPAVPSSIRHQMGFTIVEAVVVIVIVGIIVTIVVSIYLKVRAVIRGTFTTAPPTIPVTPPGSTGTGNFVFTVTRTVGGGTPAALANRKISFKVTPSSGVQIVSVTDVIGTLVPVNASTSGPTTTDSSGNITVVVKIDYVGQASLTATDTISGETETALFSGT